MRGRQWHKGRDLLNVLGGAVILLMIFPVTFSGDSYGIGRPLIRDLPLVEPGDRLTQLWAILQKDPNTLSPLDADFAERLVQLIARDGDNLINVMQQSLVEISSNAGVTYVGLQVRNQLAHLNECIYQGLTKIAPLLRQIILAYAQQAHQGPGQNTGTYPV